MDKILNSGMPLNFMSAARDDQTIFRDSIHDLGMDRFDIAACPPGETKLLLERCLIYARQRILQERLFWPEMPEVYFDLIDSPRINAIAFVEEGREFIGVNTGAILLICDLFNRIFAHPEFLKKTFPPDQETANPQMSQVFGDFDALQRDTPPSSVPVHPVRHAAANLTSMLAFDFLLSHEFGHLLNGHVSSLGEIGLPLSLQELRWTNSDGLTSMVYQALEMDADAFASNMAIANLVGGVTRPEGIPAVYRPFYKRLDHVLLFWLLAINGLFRLFPNEPDPIHPPPRLRQRMINGVIKVCLEKQGFPQIAEGIEDLALKVINDVEYAVTLISSQEYDPAGLPEAMGDEGYEYIAEILSTWKDLRPVLVPLSRGPILAH